MRKVTVVFRAEERNAASDALRVLGSHVNGSGGYSFEGLEYSHDGKLTLLSRGNVTVYVPTRNILLVHVEEKS